MPLSSSFREAGNLDFLVPTFLLPWFLPTLLPRMRPPCHLVSPQARLGGHLDGHCGSQGPTELPGSFCVTPQREASPDSRSGCWQMRPGVMVDSQLVLSRSPEPLTAYPQLEEEGPPDTGSQVEPEEWLPWPAENVSLGLGVTSSCFSTGSCKLKPSQSAVPGALAPCEC